MSEASQRTVPHPFKDIQITPDSPTIEIHDKPRLSAMDAEGQPVAQSSTSTTTKLTETLARVWNEYPDGLLDITEEELEAKPQDDAVPSQADQPEDPGRVEGMMSWEDMMKLRETTGTTMNNARNELWFVLELAKTLAVSSGFSSNPPDPPIPVPGANAPAKKKAQDQSQPVTSPKGIDASIFPPGTFSSTPITRNIPSQVALIEELEIALATKQAALAQCENMLDVAVEEMTRQARASEQFWKDLRTLKDGNNGRDQWSVVPKPDFGKMLANGEAARDVVIPYSIDEAPMPTRARCLAAFDLDPAKSAALTFGSRSNRQLSVTIIDEDGMASTSTPHAHDADINGQMNAAQLEAFDEDLFTEIRMAVTGRPGVLIEPDMVRLSVGDQTLIFQVDAKIGSKSTKTSPTTDLMLQACRLSMLNILRQRKRRMTAQSGARSINILHPILQVLHFSSISQKVKRVLDMLAAALSKLGVETRVIHRSDLLDDFSSIVKLLGGGEDYSALGAIYSLVIEDCPGISINLSATSPAILTTSTATFGLSDPDDLAMTASEDLALQLSRKVASDLKARLEDAQKDQVVFDEMDRMIYLPRDGQIRISLDPPYDAVSMRFSDSKSSGLSDGKSLAQCLAEVVEAIRQTS